ncbi:MAG: hypothetical protein IJR01_03000 [Bacteroidales bacterium]|nr:hypothetical protein [Bacteroidales bacterium]
MYKPKFILAAAAAMIMCGAASAQDAAKEALPFLRIDRNPASAAMGFAGAGLSLKGLSLDVAVLFGDLAGTIIAGLKYIF